MEAKIGGKSPHFYAPVVSEMKSLEKKSLEWDLNDWKWDGDLFIASPLNSTPSDCRSRPLFPIEPEKPINSSSSGSEDNNLDNDKGKRELEKRRRLVVVEDEDLNDEACTFNLKLGGQAYPVMDKDVKNGKKTKISGTTSNRPVCQVEDCKADLTHAKDYHRRHKVCDVHSKASKALVRNVMQRFCQQCSRFHILQEFDEGKRSCRRRLAGHNKRRRKTQPEHVVDGGSLNDGKGSNYLLISLLRILANLHSNSSNQMKEQDLLSHLLQSLASLAASADGRSSCTLPQGSQGLSSAGTIIETPAQVPDVIRNAAKDARASGSNSEKHECTILRRPLGDCGTTYLSDLAPESVWINDHSGSPQALPYSQPAAFVPSKCNPPAKPNEPEGMVVKVRSNSIDLNNVYDDSQDYTENSVMPSSPVNSRPASLKFPFWAQAESHKTSPPQVSRNSDSTSTHSLSSSFGEAQSRTDRIIFKLFGKDPNDFPVALRMQILDWLSHSPTEIESYIRPGCIILVIYLRLEKPEWEKICLDLGSSLSKLLGTSNDDFWGSGWVYARVRHCVSFMYNGQVVLDTPLPQRNDKTCRISSIRPIAVSLSDTTQFVVKGFNIMSCTTRLLCAIEGNYLMQETCYALMDGIDGINEHDKLQCLSFACSIPNFVGRGFIEVEDYGLGGSFFPFIVAEKEVCSEICMLEDVIDMTVTDDNDKDRTSERMEAKNQALDFMNEMGWLLHRSRLKLRLGSVDPNLELFPFKRFQWLMEYSMDRDWCAVVKKLLAILFDGAVDPGEHLTIELALLDMALLHRAVQRNCRAMVEMLLRYVPDKMLDRPGPEQNQLAGWGHDSFIFKPDVVGPAGLTPLHLAASGAGRESVLDALTDDPGLLGIEAWRRARDSTGLTPNDYACLGGHYSYIHLVQRKINKRVMSGQVVVDIPGALSSCNGKQKGGLKSSKVASLQMEKMETRAVGQHCKACEWKLACRQARKSLVYKPAMLSLVVIAAVCVCAALLFKSSPEVGYDIEPFRWESLKYGSS